MSAVLTEDLLDPFRRAISMLHDTIGKFNYVDALRHTMHHREMLALISVYHGSKGSSWA
jgi:hypothetical protein